MTIDRKGVIDMNKRLIIPTLGLAALTTFGVLAAGVVKADENDYPPFVQKLAQRFGLNQEEVNNFFQEQHQERNQQMENNKEERLNQAVEDGVLTQEQKDALIAKWEEIHAQREAERQQNQEEMNTWMEEQGIDSSLIMQYQGFPGGMGRHGMDKGMGSQ